MDLKMFWHGGSESTGSGLDPNGWLCVRCVELLVLMPDSRPENI